MTTEQYNKIKERVKKYSKYYFPKLQEEQFEENFLVAIEIYYKNLTKNPEIVNKDVNNYIWGIYSNISKQFFNKLKKNKNIELNNNFEIEDIEYNIDIDKKVNQIFNWVEKNKGIYENLLIREYYNSNFNYSKVSRKTGINRQTISEDLKVLFAEIKQTITDDINY
jgi:hypothetical protein